MKRTRLPIGDCAGPIPLRHGLVDDRDRGRVVGVAGIESSALAHARRPPADILVTDARMRAGRAVSGPTSRFSITTPRRPSSPVSGGNIVPPAAWIIGSAGQARFELVEEARRRSAVLVARARQADPEREAIVGLDAGRLRQHGLEAPQREARADEQQRRQRHLDDDEAEAQRALEAHRTAAAFF